MLNSVTLSSGTESSIITQVLPPADWSTSMKDVFLKPCCFHMLVDVTVRFEGSNFRSTKILSSVEPTRLPSTRSAGDEETRQLFSKLN